MVNYRAKNHKKQRCSISENFKPLSQKTADLSPVVGEKKPLEQGEAQILEEITIEVQDNQPLVEPTFKKEPGRSKILNTGKLGRT